MSLVPVADIFNHKAAAVELSGEYAIEPVCFGDEDENDSDSNISDSEDAEDGGEDTDVAASKDGEEGHASGEYSSQHPLQTAACP